MRANGGEVGDAGREKGQREKTDDAHIPFYPLIPAAHQGSWGELPAELRLLCRQLIAHRLPFGDVGGQEEQAQFLTWVGPSSVSESLRNLRSVNCAPAYPSLPLLRRADRATGTRALTLARCSYHPDRLAPDAAAVADFAAETAWKWKRSKI